MIHAFNFLVKIVFDFYLIIVLLRLWLQFVRADFYNPISQMVVKLTQPILGPMRRLIPSIGTLDTATLILAIIVAALEYTTLMLINHISMSVQSLLIYSVAGVAHQILSMLLWVVLIKAVLSWFNRGANPLDNLLTQLTTPLVRPIKRFIPTIAGIDFSYLILFVFIQFLQILVSSWLPY